MNDVDIEQAEAHVIGNAISQARRQGVCLHLSARGSTCTDGCGQDFGTEEAWLEAMQDALNEWT